MTPRSYIRTLGLSRAAVTFFGLQNKAISDQDRIRNTSVSLRSGARVFAIWRASGTASLTRKMGQIAPVFGTICRTRNRPSDTSEGSSKGNSRRSYGSGGLDAIRSKGGRRVCRVARPGQGLPSLNRSQAACGRATHASGAHRPESSDSTRRIERIRAARSRHALPGARIAHRGSFCADQRACLLRNSKRLRLPALWVVETVPGRRHVSSLPTVAGGVLC